MKRKQLFWCLHLVYAKEREQDLFLIDKQTNKTKTKSVKPYIKQQQEHQQYNNINKETKCADNTSSFHTNTPMPTDQTAKVNAIINNNNKTRATNTKN